MLEPQVGYVVRLRFRPASGGPATSITWEAVVEDGAVVTGKLTLHASVADDEVTSWAVVTVDRTP